MFALCDECRHIKRVKRDIFAEIWGVLSGQKNLRYTSFILVSLSTQVYYIYKWVQVNEMLEVTGCHDLPSVFLTRGE